MMRIKRSDLIYTVVMFFLMLLSFQSDYEETFGGLSTYIRIAAEALSLVYGLILIGKRKIIDGFIVFLAFMQLQLVFSGFVNGTEWFPFVKRALHILAACILIKGACKKDTLSLLRGSILAFLLLGFIHLSYRIPDKEILHMFGAGSIYYLGTDNEAVSPMLFLFTASLLYWQLRGRNWLSFIGILVPVFTIFYSKSGTGMMALIIFALGFSVAFIPAVRKVIEKLSNAKVMMIAFATYYLILWGVALAKLTFLGTWISNITGKNSVTFTNRDVIWMEAMNIISKQPLFGIGYGEGAGGNGVYANGFYRGAHNAILQWGVNGGLIAVGLFLIALYLVYKRIEKIQFPLKYYLYLCCLIFLIAMSMENYSNGLHFLPMLSIIYYSRVEQYVQSKSFLFGKHAKRTRRTQGRYGAIRVLRS